ncbi:GAP family protein [Cryobacterium breve]|uniref:GAP family protein n=1 Tax=Cryobacterium breve TaxID=1259258 RepID=UPI003D7C338B
MLPTIGRLLPLALAVALSTTPILVTVLLLLSPKQRWSAPAFLAGWIVGLIVVTAAFTATLTWLPPRTCRSCNRPWAGSRSSSAPLSSGRACGSSCIRRRPGWPNRPG